MYTIIYIELQLYFSPRIEIFHIGSQIANNYLCKFMIYILQLASCWSYK